MQHENLECQISNSFSLLPCGEDFAQTKRAAGKRNICVQIKAFSSGCYVRQKKILIFLTT